MLIDKRLFEIDKGEQKSPKGGKNAPKSGRKKNFHFGNFGVQKWEKVGELRKKDRQNRLRLKPQIGEKKIDEKIGKRLRRSTASVF